MNRNRPTPSGLPAFTLAELLIALLIMGEIATFTIPKVISATQTNTYNAEAKEVAGMLTETLMKYRVANGAIVTMGPADLTPYMNYVKVDSVTVIDDVKGWSSLTCGAGNVRCLLLHNGGILSYDKNIQFKDTATTSAIYFGFDADAKYLGGDSGPTSAGPSKALELYLYYNGLVRTKATVITGSKCNNFTLLKDANGDPPWFSW